MQYWKTIKTHLALGGIVALCFFFPQPAISTVSESSLILTLPPILAGHGQTGPKTGWWQPKPGTSWQWQLSGAIDTSFTVDMYDIDYQTYAAVIAELHVQGKKVICYLSAGSWEAYRSDADLYPLSILGNTLEGWQNERWVDIRQVDVLGPIIEARMDVAVANGCDGIEPDNVDGFQNNSGFPLTPADQLAFNKWVAHQAHARKLSVGLKNDLAQVVELEPYFDWALNEECFQYNECDALLPFVQAGKAVFGVEYAGDPAVFCPEANRRNHDWLMKNPALNPWRYSCR